MSHLLLIAAFLGIGALIVFVRRKAGSLSARIGLTKFEDRYSADQLSNTALTSAGLVWALLVFLMLPTPEQSRGLIPWTRIEGVAILLTMAALFVMYRAVAAFQRGADAERWPRQTLDRIATTLNRPLWRHITSAVALGIVAYFLFDMYRRHVLHHHRDSDATLYAYGWMTSLFLLARLKAALQPKPAKRQPAIWRDGMKPIVSEHWGNRGSAAL